MWIRYASSVGMRTTSTSLVPVNGHQPKLKPGFFVPTVSAVKGESDA